MMHHPTADDILDGLPDALVVTDESGTMVRVNARARQLLKSRGEELLGHALAQVLATISGKDLWTTGARRGDGTTVPVEVTRGSHTVAGHSFTAFVLRDLGERRQRSAKVEFLSTHDSLTGLANRASFDEALDSLQANGPWPVAMLMLDVDGLKLTNDRRGHVAGDALLRQTASVLRQTFRDSDLIARIGGDEFAVLAPATDSLVIENLAERLEAARIEANRTAEYPLAFSVGTAVATRGQRMREVLQAADSHMYAMKERHHALTPR